MESIESIETLHHLHQPKRLLTSYKLRQQLRRIGERSLGQTLEMRGCLPKPQEIRNEMHTDKYMIRGYVSGEET